MPDRQGQTWRLLFGQIVLITKSEPASHPGKTMHHCLLLDDHEGEDEEGNKWFTPKGTTCFVVELDELIRAPSGDFIIGPWEENPGHERLG